MLTTDELVDKVFFSVIAHSQDKEDWTEVEKDTLAASLALVKLGLDALLSIADSQKALAAQAKGNNPIHNPQVDL